MILHYIDNIIFMSFFPIYCVFFSLSLPTLSLPLSFSLSNSIFASHEYHVLSLWDAKKTVRVTFSFDQVYQKLMLVLFFRVSIQAYYRNIIEIE